MSDLADIKAHMPIIGADGVRLGTVLSVAFGRVALTRDDNRLGRIAGQHHFITGIHIASVRPDGVRLNANGDVAIEHESDAERRLH